jgi:hypothetical protein
MCSGFIAFKLIQAHIQAKKMSIGSQTNLSVAAIIIESAVLYLADVIMLLTLDGLKVYARVIAYNIVGVLVFASNLVILMITM